MYHTNTVSYSSTDTRLYVQYIILYPYCEDLLSTLNSGYTGGSASPDVLLEHPLLLCCEDDMGVSNDEENLVLW